MKHLLPILTLALLGAVATVSADNFYYEYYKDVTSSGITPMSYDYDAWNHYTYDTDTTTYKDFEVTRNSDWKTKLGAQSKSNFYRIHVLGNDVDLFLTDYVDNIGDNLQNDNSNALYNKISEYGYRKLVKNSDGLYVPAPVNPEDADDVNQNGIIEYKVSYVDGVPMITDEQGNITKATAIDTITYAETPVDRFQYHLGTFNDTDIIELYMKDLEGNVDYSYSNFNAVYEGQGPIGAQGGFGDGGYVVSESTDKMLYLYYFDEDKMTADGYIGFGDPTDPAVQEKRKDAANKAMPLSQLAPDRLSIYFGIIANPDSLGNGGSGGDGGVGASGQPLPGGLPIALVAALFGLGFWYIRRRKTTVA